MTNGDVSHHGIYYPSKINLEVGVSKISEFQQHYDVIKHLGALHSSPLLFSPLASIPRQYKMADIAPHSHSSSIPFESRKLQQVEEAAFSLHPPGQIKEENPCYSNGGPRVTASSLTWELIKMQCPQPHTDH